ncbi:cytochrome P450 [Suillus clintonianus]|uniref:cytochrome P450 n=1 Tax=Suillus clintonianus TaxID=1904413 RepID=UPI001B8824BE|nr:cytochrome P450 [Suillus clintonianus]KAG2153366.1 cytochrome P450 [Suillus clintonianus]
MLMNLSLFAASAFGGVITLFLVRVIARRRTTYSASLPRPPGPKPLPVIGNVMDISLTETWLSYTALKKIYGDLVRLRLMGQEFAIINSEKIAHALLDQRSAIYSDRPILPARKFYGIEWLTILLPYGAELRAHRKLFHHALQAESSLRQREIYLRRAWVFLASLLHDPEEFEAHIQRFVAAIVMEITYGYEVQSENDPYVSAVSELNAILTKGLTPERSAILLAFPFLTHIPAWFPGAKFQREALHSRQLAQKVLNAPFEFTKSRIAAGTASQSLVFDCLTQIDEDNNEAQEYVIKGAAATVFIAGFETSSSILHGFILAMVLYPKVQAKAQAEIDTFVGSTRLPSFEDRPSLPYIEAILRELLRWSPAIPLGVSHATSSDDIFEGYFIPKGACVTLNVWAINQDEEKYPDPDEFRPERHFATDGSLLSDSISDSPVFGYGRRICPGRFSAESIAWVAIVSILATFRIEKAKGVDGREIDVKKQYTTGLSIHPVPFRCALLCRSAQKEKMVRENSDS